jgi:predicted NAD/FAD-binding protein
MTACIWSTPPDKCAMDFPARTLVRDRAFSCLANFVQPKQIQFLNNHHLLQITGKPSWLTLEGGSRVYVNQILSKLPAAQLHLSSPVKAVSTASKVQLTLSSGVKESYDHVIFACHSDTALSILQAGEGGATQDEKDILGMFQWNQNEAVLHSDDKVLPSTHVTCTLTPTSTSLCLGAVWLGPAGITSPSRCWTRRAAAKRTRIKSRCMCF